jgi:hypothetical protein
VYSELSDADQRVLAEDATSSDGETPAMRPVGGRFLGERLIIEITPVLLYRSLTRQNPMFWIDQATQTREHAEMLQVQTESRSFDDLIIESQPSTLASLSVDLDEMFDGGHPGVLVPRGTDIRIDFNSDNKPAKLQFVRSDLLEIEIAVRDLGGLNLMLGLPPDYPQSSSETHATSSRVSLEISAEFGYPAIEDPTVRLNRYFAEGIRSFIEEHWSWSTFVDSLPPAEIYEIRESVSQLDGKLDRVLDEHDDE